MILKEGVVKQIRFAAPSSFDRDLRKLSSLSLSVSFDIKIYSVVFATSIFISLKQQNSEQKKRIEDLKHTLLCDILIKEDADLLCRQAAERSAL